MMRQLYYAIRVLLHRKGDNLFKVPSLGLGLAMSILLFSRVAYEQSYDTCFKDYDRLYQVWNQFIVNGEKLDWSDMNLGPVAGSILESFPEQVEAATCTNRWMASRPLYYEGNRFDERKVAADSLFFRTMGIEVLSGNPVQDLQQPDVVYLSESLARRMFGGEDPIGKVVSYDHERDLTVRGTYADLPDNTTVPCEAVMSMPPAWAAGVTNYSWSGGDSFFQYVRLRDKRDAGDINRRLDAMIDRYRPDTYKGLFGYASKIAPLRDTFRGYDEVRRSKVILLVMGLSILFIAALNYALLSISSLSRRAKAVGVQKCNGASGAGIFGMFMLETGVVVLLALAFMAFLLYAFRDFVEDTAATSLSNLFALERIWVPALTVLLLFVVGGVLPGRLFARIPVTQVFRRYTEGKKSWKRPLLFVQFAGVAFICGVMWMVTAQYAYVAGKDMGFTMEGVATGSLTFDTTDECRAAEAYFRGLPYVQDVTAGGNPLRGYSGTIVTDEAGRSLFNTRMDFCRYNYHSFMGMTLLDGRLPRQGENRDGEAIVNQTFARMMHWGDDVVGRTFHAEGRTWRVTALLKDFQVGGFYAQPEPYMARTDMSFYGTLFFKLKEPFAENLHRLRQDAAQAYPAKTLDITSMQRQADSLYNPVRVLRNAMLVAALVMACIMLMGLLGYVSDEVQRRSKEIAVRKVNGAEASAILELLGRGIMLIAIPAVALGTCASAYVNGLWMSAFSVQVPGGWAAYVVVPLANLLVILSCVLWRTWRIANENPVTSLKSE